MFSIYDTTYTGTFSNMLFLETKALWKGNRTSFIKTFDVQFAIDLYTTCNFRY